ncbi:DUF547 domain-containing protein [Algihabitans albus]|uniref:DUF547 domain-containing protein n=1 Tax=Algihabitans albus TaxID=2164067 RepID=UPI0013C33E56|nr:DUF547 domain-containing protein [Algihabitans albus]
MPASITRRSLLTGMTLAGPLAAFPQTVQAAPNPELWEHWNYYDPRTLARIDHGDFGRLLQIYLKTQPITGGVDSLFHYGAVTPGDRAALDGYVARLSDVPITQYPRSEQLAYWVNLYNALVLQQVLKVYPVASVRDVDLSGAFFTGGPWAEKLVTVEHRAVSLNDIEHRILRPIWRDPRLHYVLNCAAIGCPHLAADALDARRLEDQLESAATAFVNHPRSLQMRFNGLRVSSIYVWYGRDFGYGRSAVLEHLRRYARGARAALLTELDDWASHDYDWRLNDYAPLQG